MTPIELLLAIPSSSVLSGIEDSQRLDSNFLRLHQVPPTPPVPQRLQKDR